MISLPLSEAQFDPALVNALIGSPYWSSEAFREWAHNNVRGKKGFQPKPETVAANLVKKLEGRLWHEGHIGVVEVSDQPPHMYEIQIRTRGIGSDAFEADLYAVRYKHDGYEIVGEAASLQTTVSRSGPSSISDVIHEVAAKAASVAIGVPVTPGVGGPPE